MTNEESSDCELQAMLHYPFRENDASRVDA